VNALIYAFDASYAAGCALMASNAWGFSERVHLAFRRTWVQMGNNAFNKTARLNLWMGALPFIVWRLFFAAALVGGICVMATSP
jgi:hypothetical protein